MPPSRSRYTRRLSLLVLPLALLGSGLACHRKPLPHSVTLTWQPPKPMPDVTVVGYNVYRRSSTGGPLVRLASKVAGPPYEDHLVLNGRTYFYVVTALDSKGRESGFSAEIRAVVPVD